MHGEIAKENREKCQHSIQSDGSEGSDVPVLEVVAINSDYVRREMEGDESEMEKVAFSGWA